MADIYLESMAAANQRSGQVVCSVLIPCLNEEENVRGAITAAAEGAQDASCPIEIIVIDDGSTDATFQRAQEMIDLHPDWPIRLKKHEKNQGYALSFLDGARMSKGQYCKIHCGDNVFPRDTVAALLSAIGTSDIVIPYDFVMQGRSRWRKFLSRTYTLLVNIASGFHLKYYNGCPILSTEKVLKYTSPSSGFGFQADMLCRILEAGATYAECEVRFIERLNGQSTAITFKNLVKVAGVLSQIFIRRLSRVRIFKTFQKIRTVRQP